MATILLPLLAGNWPQGLCPSSSQENLNAIASLLKAVLPGQTFYNYGDTKPAPEYQSYPWLYSTDMRWYKFSGVWQSPNPETSTLSRRIFVGNESDVWAYDGGDGSDPSTTAPTATSGAMWEVDHSLDGRVPIGAGVIPTSSPSASVLVGGTGDDQGGSGEYKHTISTIESPKHDHGMIDPNTDPNQVGVPVFEYTASQWRGNNGPTARIAQFTPFGGDPANGGATSPHNNMQPYYGVFFIRRTARVYYVVI